MSARAKQKGARKSGWLSKRGGRIHTWHKRWFVLTGDLLFYYKSSHDSRPTGTIPLAGNRVVRHLDDSKQPTSFKFEIVAGSDRHMISSTHETYLIGAESAEDADSWTAAISRVMHEPYGGGMFGRSLEETMQVEARLGGAYIPVLLHRCVKFILENGLSEIGIFRLPGQSSRVQQLKLVYDQGSQKEIPRSEDIHTVASLLKLFLRELPEPVIPFAYYESFHKATCLFENNRIEAVDEIKRLIIQLPKVNFNVLKYLCRFLHEVQQHSDVNKMTCMNLGTVFGPNILRPKTNDPQALMECSNFSADLVCIVISKQEEFFPLTPDERPPKRLSIVLPPDEFPVAWQESKLYTRSFHNTKAKPREGHRPRQNSAPVLDKTTIPRQTSAGKVASMVEQFNQRTSNPQLQQHFSVDMSSNGFPELSALQPNGHHVPHKENGLPGDGSDDDDDDVPAMLKRLSAQAGFIATSDSLSSEVIVNSISNELEILEKQLAVAKQELAKYKKAARVWKSRYDQERRARLAAENQIRDLQRLIDDTFKQFALDDSEDDFESEDSLSSDTGTPVLLKRTSVLTRSSIQSVV